MQLNTVVVTGASGGIGRATAIEFAKRGWRVALLARGADGLEAARREVERAGGKAMLLQADVADPAQVEAAAERVEREWGPIDVWVNNAMATVFGDCVRIAADDFKRATEVTYLGAVWGTLAALKHMRVRDRGVIVQVGSALAYRSIPLQSAYCGAKSALRGFTDSLRCELIHDNSNIRLTMVQLSAFNTPQFDWSRNALASKPRPFGTIFQPELAARGIYWAALHPRRELWVGLPAVEAILGTRLAAALLDRKLAFAAYEGQETAAPVWPQRQDNLYQPVPGDHGVHGRFDREAVRWSAQLWLNTHRWTAAAALLCGMAAAAWWLR